MCCTSSRAVQSQHWTEWRASGKPVTGWSRTLSQNQSEPSQIQQWPREMEFHPGAGSTTRFWSQQNQVKMILIKTYYIYLLTYRPFSLRIQPWPKAKIALIKLIKTWLLKSFRINYLPQFWRYVCCCSVYLPLGSRKTSVILLLVLIRSNLILLRPLLWYFTHYIKDKFWAKPSFNRWSICESYGKHTLEVDTTSVETSWRLLAEICLTHLSIRKVCLPQIHCPGKSQNSIKYLLFHR